MSCLNLKTSNLKFKVYFLLLFFIKKLKLEFEGVLRSIYFKLFSTMIWNLLKIYLQKEASSFYYLRKEKSNFKNN